MQGHGVDQSSCDRSDSCSDSSQKEGVNRQPARVSAYASGTGAVSGTGLSQRSSRVDPQRTGNRALRRQRRAINAIASGVSTSIWLDYLHSADLCKVLMMEKLREEKQKRGKCTRAGPVNI